MVAPDGYAGPIRLLVGISADGRVLGVVGVATRAERTFTTDDEQTVAIRSRAFFV
jgi:hypothetical protein